MHNRTKYEHPDFFLVLNLYFFFGDCETRAILGVVFRPIVGVMLTDYFIIKTHRNILQETQQLEKIPANKDTPLIGWNTVCACIIASIIGITVEVGIPTINSLLAACIIYGLLSKIKR